jgi:hypothetical protein
MSNSTMLKIPPRKAESEEGGMTGRPEVGIRDKAEWSRVDAVDSKTKNMGIE